MAKVKGKKKFELLHPIWSNATEQLPAGTVVTFEDDEPTGVFIDRVKELVDSDAVVEVASPDAAPTDPVPPAPPAPTA